MKCPNCKKTMKHLGMIGQFYTDDEDEDSWGCKSCRILVQVVSSVVTKDNDWFDEYMEAAEE